MRNRKRFLPCLLAAAMAVTSITPLTALADSAGTDVSVEIGGVTEDSQGTPESESVIITDSPEIADQAAENAADLSGQDIAADNNSEQNSSEDSSISEDGIIVETVTGSGEESSVSRAPSMEATENGAGESGESNNEEQEQCTAPEWNTSLLQYTFDGYYIGGKIFGKAGTVNTSYAYYYTVDGSDPSAENGTKLTGANFLNNRANRGITEAIIKAAPVNEEGYVVIKVAAVKNGFRDSEIVSCQIKMPAEGMVLFADQNLKKALLEKLGKGTDLTTGITAEDMAGLTELDLSGKGIKDLTGIGQAVNLEVLNLSGNPIDDDNRYAGASFGKTLSNLTTLTSLKELDLSNCRLGDNYVYNVGMKISNCPSAALELCGISSLKRLNLADNDLPLYGFTFGKESHVEELNLSGNHIANTSYAESLRKLDLSRNNFWWDERDAAAAKLMEHQDEIEINRSDMNNLAQLRALYYCGNGDLNTTSANYKPVLVNPATKVIDLGTVSGDVTIALTGYMGANTTKATLADQKFTVQTYENFYEFGQTYNHAVLEGLDPGEHTYQIDVQHLGGDTESYTLKFVSAEVPGNEEEASAGIKDVTLQKAVCTKLGIADQMTSHVITQEEMASLTGTLKVENLRNAEGLQYATGITGLYLSGNFKKLPDLTGMTSLTSLVIISPVLETLVDLSVYPNLTVLTMSGTTDGRIPDVSLQTELTQISFYYLKGGTLPAGLSNCGKLKTAGFTSCEGSFDLGTAFRLSGTNLDIHITAPVEGAEFSFANGSESGISSLKLVYENLESAKDVHLTGLDENTPLTSIQLNGPDDGLLPDTLGQVKTLTSLLVYNGGALTRLPESLSENTSLKNVTINDPGCLPAVLGKVKSLESLTVANAVTVPDEMDFSQTSMTSLTLRKCAIKAVPKPECLPSTLTSLNLNSSFITEITGDYSGLTSLKTLNLGSTKLYRIPEALGTFAALETLDLSENLYGAVPDGILTKLTGLKSLTLGMYLPVQKDGTAYVIDPAYPDTKQAVEAVDAMIKENGGSGVTINPGMLPYQSMFPDYSYAGLAALDSSVGMISDTMSYSPTVDYRLPEGTETIRLKPVAILPDTTITYEGKEYQSGDEIEITDLSQAVTPVVLTTNLKFKDAFGSSTSKTYTINLYGGAAIDAANLEDGKTYQIDYKLNKSNQETTSMSAGYFTKKAVVRVKGGQYEVRITTSKSGWISDMDYYDPEGVRHDAEQISVDKEIDYATYRMYTNDLGKIMVISPFVVPMGYYPLCDLVFDLNSITDVSDLYTEADKTELNIAVNRAEEIVAKVNEARNIYSETSYAAMMDALDAAKQISENADASQTAVDETAAALTGAIDALEIDSSKLADKAALEEALTTAKALEKGNHTDTNWDALQEAIADAQEVFDDIYASTKEVNMAVSALNNTVKSFNSSGEASSLDPENLADGEYSVYVEMINAANPAQKSMSDGAVTKPVRLTVKDGNYTVTVNFHGINIPLGGKSFFGYMKELSYWDGNAGDGGTGAYVPVTVDSTYDEMNEYNDADGDGRADYLYPHQMSFPLVNKAAGDDEDGYVHVQVFVPIMEALSEGSGTQQALMKIDWSSLKKGAEDAEEAQQKEAAVNALNSTVADAKNTSNASGTYTAESYAALQEAIKAAEALAKDPNATKAQLEAAKKAVQDAKNNLKKASGSTGANTGTGSGTSAGGTGAGTQASKIKAGKTYTVGGQSYKVTKVAAGSMPGTVTFTKAKNAKNVTVPATVKLADGKTYKVTQIGAKAFTGKKIKKVTVGANITKFAKNAFAKSKAKTVVLKTKSLKKAGVKGALKGSKIKKIQVKAGSKKVNKKLIKSYKKIFTKKIAGKKVSVK